MDFQAVVFDMDGIIFDSEKLVIGCWKEVDRAAARTYCELDRSRQYKPKITRQISASSTCGLSFGTLSLRLCGLHLSALRRRDRL